MLAIDGLESGYGGSGVLRGVRMEIRPGQVVCLMGRNGVGKTTLMKTIMGLIRAASGSITFEGRNLTRAAPYERARAGIGYVPQGREIFSQLTVEENLLLGLEAGRSLRGGIPDTVFRMFPVLRDMQRRKGGDLSGGQQQQLAIGRALASGPRLLLLDEPTEGIQPSIVQDIEQAIETVKAGGQTAILLVEQSLEFASRIADYTYIMDKGTIVAEGRSSSFTREHLQRHLAV